MIRSTDSSLIDEWQSLIDATDPASPVVTPAASVASDDGDLTHRPKALRAIVRTRVLRWVQLAARRAWPELHADLAEAGDTRLSSEALAAAFGEYFAEHDSIGIDADARGPHRFQVIDRTAASPNGRRVWTVHQQIADPAGFDEWLLSAEFDLDATERDGELRAKLIGVNRV